MPFKNLSSILCDPKTFQNVFFEKDSFVCEDQKSVYPVLDNIPSFLKEGDVVGDNAKYQKLYDKIGRFTGAGFWSFCRAFRLDTVSKRKELLSELVVQAGDNALETSIGAGANIPPLTKDAKYIGVDISLEMLRACQKYHLVKPYDLTLVHANAEQLPFKDNVFDVVFHVGGINFFTDPKQAVKEMVRVAKPGALLLICDETQKEIDSWYCKLPFVKKYFQNMKPVSPSLDLIPEDMLERKISYKWDETMYVITFLKP